MGTGLYFRKKRFHFVQSFRVVLQVIGSGLRWSNIHNNNSNVYSSKLHIKCYLCMVGRLNTFISIMIDWTKTVVYQIHVLENQVRSSKIHLHFQFLPNSTHFINRRCVIWRCNFFSNLWFDFCSTEWLEMLETTELSNKMHQEWIHDCAENIRFV